MVNGTTLTNRPSLVVSLSTTTANDDGSMDSILPHFGFGNLSTVVSAQWNGDDPAIITGFF